MIAEPTSAGEFAEAIKSAPRVLAVGARTKPRLSTIGGDCTLITTRKLSGIVEYDPGEYTFSALAGTPLREIAATLAEKGQYLPFDPPLLDAGATLGGTIAAGLSGPGRFRFGGLRDFILAVRFVDGNGELLRMGAKVVKNAAGFDLPKFFIGSLGRFGALVEATFKVFPRPPAWLTVRIPAASPAEAVERLAAAANSRWELDALDYLPGENCILARLAGPAESNAALAQEITGRWPGSAVFEEDEASEKWRNIREFAWAHADGLLAKVPVTLNSLAAFVMIEGTLKGSRIHVSAGGDVAYVSLPSPADHVALNTLLKLEKLRALVIRGEGVPLLLGAKDDAVVHGAVRVAVDPSGRYPDLT